MFRRRSAPFNISVEWEKPFKLHIVSLIRPGIYLAKNEHETTMWNEKWEMRKREHKLYHIMISKSVNNANFIDPLPFVLLKYINGVVNDDFYGSDSGFGFGGKLCTFRPCICIKYLEYAIGCACYICMRMCECVRLSVYFSHLYRMRNGELCWWEDWNGYLTLHSYH